MLNYARFTELCLLFVMPKNEWLYFLYSNIHMDNKVANAFEAIKFLNANFGKMQPKSHRSKSPKKKSKKRRSRSRSPKPRRHKSRSRSRSRATKCLTIKSLKGGRWLRHFHKYREELFNKCDKEGQIIINVCDSISIKCNSINIRDFDDLYYRSDELCDRCYNGVTLEKNGRAYCYDCSFKFGTQCYGNYENCLQVAYNDTPTYSTRGYCNNCHRIVKRVAAAASERKIAAIPETKTSFEPFDPRTEVSFNRNFDPTVITAIDQAKWLWHFYNNKSAILSLFNDKKFIWFKIRTTSLEDTYDILLTKKNVADLSDLYLEREKLCLDCYHGLNLKNINLLCDNCVKLHSNIRCKNCSTEVVVDRITYTSQTYCELCWPLMKRIIYNVDRDSCEAEYSHL